MQTVVSFVFAIGLLVAVHELGHYWVAVASGVKVLRFSIGFGPRLFGWTSAKSGTEFIVGVLPLGGYVKMLDEREGVVALEERSRAFNVQPLRTRAAIVSAGPIANLLFAVLLHASINWVGFEQAQAILSKPVAGSIAERAGWQGGERIHRVGFENEPLEQVASFEDFRWWLTRAALANRNMQVEFSAPNAGMPQLRLLELNTIDARIADATMFRSIGILGPFSKAQLGDLVEGGEASRSGLLAGDEVLQVDQTPVIDAGQLREIIRNSGLGGAVSPQVWLVNRGGQRLIITVTPKVEQAGGVAIGRIGAFVGIAPAMVTVSYGPIDGVERALIRTWEVSVLSLKMMGQMLVGEASLKNLSGPLTIADYAGKSAAMGLTQFLVFLALISISLGVLNLLPFPVLDGGHLMYYLWEFLTGKSVSETWMSRFQKVGLVVLLMMMSVALFNDVTRLLS